MKDFYKTLCFLVFEYLPHFLNRQGPGGGKPSAVRLRQDEGIHRLHQTVQAKHERLGFQVYELIGTFILTPSQWIIKYDGDSIALEKDGRERSKIVSNRRSTFCRISIRCVGFNSITKYMEDGFKSRSECKTIFLTNGRGFLK